MIYEASHADDRHGFPCRISAVVFIVPYTLIDYNT